MNKKQNYTIDDRNKYLHKRNIEVLRLRDSTSQLHYDQIQEYVDAIIKSYRESTVVDIIAMNKEEKTVSSRGYRSIGIYQSIEKDKLFAKDYYWRPFFSDVGRAIARGERQYIHSRLGKYIRGVHEKISFSDPDPNILREHVIKLLNKNIKPNIILAPVQIEVEFMTKLWDKIPQPERSIDQIRIEGCDIKIIWSHKYAPLHSFIIFDSTAGIWHTVQDAESMTGITVAMGESKNSEKQIVYIAETVAYYEILSKDAFTRINLSY